MITFDQAIDSVMQLPTEQQEMLINIFYRRLMEKKRKEIAADAKESISAFHDGRLKPQPVQEIILELRNTLNEEKEL